jgi:hypothetical protein
LVAEVAQVFALYWVALAALAAWLLKMGSDLDRKIGERGKQA